MRISINMDMMIINIRVLDNKLMRIVLDGIKLQPWSNFVSARDIIAADQLQAVSYCMIWKCLLRGV
jgi:hypothetical protein